MYNVLKKPIFVGSAIVLLTPTYAANATATFYGSIYSHISLLDIVQINASEQTTNKSVVSDPSTVSTQHTLGLIGRLGSGASIVETSYLSGGAMKVDPQAKPGVTAAASLGRPQDLYVSLLDETVTITADNDVDNTSTGAGNQQPGDVLIVLETAPASGLARVAEAANRSSLIGSCPDSSFDETGAQGFVKFEAPDISIEVRAFEDAVRHRRHKFRKPDPRLLIQLN